MSFLKVLQKKYKTFQELNTEIFAICVDSKEKNKKVKTRLGLSFEILSDPKLETGKSYGLLHEKPFGISHPISRPGEFLLNQEGKIFQRWLPESTYGRTHAESILAEIRRMDGKEVVEVSKELSSKKQVISARRTAPQIGLQDTSGKALFLSDYTGKKNVIVTFFRGYWSEYCTAFLLSLQQNYDVFKSLDTEILAISVDSVEANRETKKKLGLSFPVLSDTKLKVSRAYGMVQEKLKGFDGPLARPGEFLIDKKRVIFQGWLPDKANERTEVATMIQDLRRMIEQKKKEKEKEKKKEKSE